MSGPSQATPPLAPSPKIVGIGASAGGLAALRALLARLPPEPGVVLVVVVHLAPDRRSHLAELLATVAPMPVEQVTRTVRMEPNRVYVIPPGANLSAIDTHLRLSELEPRRVERAPIDRFFSTLAETHDGNAMGIVLTGGGSDGTLGLRRIREQGGVTLAQDPEEAECDGMPQSAIASGTVDRVLSLAGLAAEIASFARTRPRVSMPPDEGRAHAPAVADHERLALQVLFDTVRAHTGQDLGQYRETTILRRLRRRMQLQHVETLPAYLDLVETREGEAKALLDDLLITVTEFFRDPQVYAVLEREALPRLFDSKRYLGGNGRGGGPDRVRVWSVGCSTGEEAYSLAILLVEEASRHGVRPQLQVFASDLNEAALRKAREGIYPEEIAAQVSPERLDRFFVREHGHYRVTARLRDLVVFASHNLLKDPPFARIDLLVCRNVLIYLKREVQRQALERFHYALSPNGLLLLGTSEGIDRGELFAPVTGCRGLHCRRAAHAVEPWLGAPAEIPQGPHGSGRGPLPTAADPAERFGIAHARMVERCAPPSVLVDTDERVVHYSPQAGRWLRMPGGAPTHDICRLVRPPLGDALRAALGSARRSGRTVRVAPLAVHTEGGPRRVGLSVRPAEEPELAGLVLVTFDECEAPVPPEPSPGPLPEVSPDPSQAAPQRADAELRSVEQELRATLEELAAAREALENARRSRARASAGASALYRMSADWSELRELYGRGGGAAAAGAEKDWLAAYIAPDDRPRVLAAIREAVERKRRFELEHRVRRADGTLGWALLRAVPFLDERGEIAEWFGAATDIASR